MKSHSVLLMCLLLTVALVICSAAPTDEVVPEASAAEASAVSVDKKTEKRGIYGGFGYGGLGGYYGHSGLGHYGGGYYGHHYPIAHTYYGHGHGLGYGHYPSYAHYPIGLYHGHGFH